MQNSCRSPQGWTLSQKTECDLDRATENVMVLEYQETREEELFNIILKNRTPTLNYWTSLKYNNNMIIDSPEDFLEDSKLVLLNAINTYKKEGKDFNTWLYTLLLNRLKNIYQQSSCLKRMLVGHQGTRATQTISLQSPVEGTDGTIGTLEDKLASRVICGEAEAVHSSQLVNTVAHIIEEDLQKQLYPSAPKISDIIISIVDGWSVMDLAKKYNVNDGAIYHVIRCIRSNKHKYKKYIQK